MNDDASIRQEDRGLTLAALQECFPDHYHDDLRLAQSSLLSWQIVKDRLRAIPVPTPRQRAQAIREVLDAAIDSLRPPHQTKQDDYSTPVLRRYTLADGYYRRNLSAGAMQDHLALSKSSFYRERDDVMDALSEILCAWERQALSRIKMSGVLPMVTCSRLFGVEMMLAQVSAAITKDETFGVVVLDGLGGVGKTALARAAVENVWQSESFGALAWVTAQREVFTWGEIRHEDQPALTVDQLINRLGEQLGQADLVSLPLAEKQQAVLKKLRAARTLIVVDNLETSADVRSIAETLWRLAQQSGARLLITSRHRLDAYETVTAFHVAGLSEIDSIEFARHDAAERGVTAVAQADAADLRAIATATGGNPLAIKLIVGHISALPLRQVLDDLRRIGNLSDQMYLFIYRRSWQILSDSARELLLALAHLPLTGGKWEVMQAISELSLEILQSSLRELVTLSLVQVSEHTTPVYQIHPLTRQFILSDLIGELQ